MKKSYFIAILITICAALWIGSGFIVSNDTITGAEQAGTDQKPDEKKVMKVQVQTVSPQNYTKSISSNGRSQASKNIIVRAEAEGLITEIIANEGDAIETGAEIIKIDVREKRERVRESRELVKQRKIEYDAAKKLIKQGFASDVRLAQTQSAYESARASLTRAQIDLDKTIVKAPFDGILGKRHVDIGDYVRIGDPLSELVDLNPLEITVFLNEKEIIQLKKGAKATLTFINGEKRDGFVKFIAPAADEDSRTFRVDVEIDNEDMSLPAGLTAQVDIEVRSKQAYQIPPSILTLNDAGDVGVKVVSNENKAVFTPITIIDDSPSSMWVTGLEGDVRVVTVGQDFLVPGQVVEAVEGD